MGRRTLGTNARQLWDEDRKFIGTDGFGIGRTLYWGTLLFEDLVKAQAFPEHSLRSEAEPAKAAAPPTWRHIVALEVAIVAGIKAQERVMAVFFVSLINTSHRIAKGQTTRRLKLTEEALLEESLVKGKASWKRWAAARE